MSEAAAIVTGFDSKPRNYNAICPQQRDRRPFSFKISDDFNKNNSCLLSKLHREKSKKSLLIKGRPARKHQGGRQPPFLLIPRPLSSPHKLVHPSFFTPFCHRLNSLKPFLSSSHLLRPSILTPRHRVKLFNIR